ncbi:UNVERIFIED_CONTAM: MFS transporter [Prevotella sp. 15_C9]
MTDNCKRRDWLWLSTVHFTRGLPYVIVFLVSLVFYNRMGQSNGTITLNTSWFFVPFILRPFLGRVVNGYSTKRSWILAMELLMAFCMFGVASSISSRHWSLLTAVFFFIMGCGAVVHDVAIARFYRLYLNSRQMRMPGVFGAFLLLSMVVGLGIPTMIAGNLEVLKRSIITSWTLTFRFLSLTFLVLFFYHFFMIPRVKDKPSIALWSGTTKRWWMETKTAFMQLPDYMALLCFLLFFLIPEGMFFRIAPLFLIDPGSNGGLSLSPQELGLTQGTLGAFASIFGLALGVKYVRRYGLRRCLWSMTIALTLPKLLFIYLSHNFISTLSIVNACVVVEQFGFGYGITAYLFLLFYCSRGKYSVFKFSMASALAAFSLMSSGWFTGILQEYVGYRRFFVIVAVVNILPFLVAAFLKKSKALANQSDPSHISISD